MQKQGHRGFHSGKGNHSYLLPGYITALEFTRFPNRIRKKRKIYNVIKKGSTSK